MDFGMAWTALLSLAVVLGLVLLAARIARRLGLAAGTARPLAGAAKRLTLLESLPLDARRRLLLVRCDGQDVLLLTGGPQDVVVPMKADAA